MIPCGTPMVDLKGKRDPVQARLPHAGGTEQPGFCRSRAAACPGQSRATSAVSRCTRYPGRRDRMNDDNLAAASHLEEVFSLVSR
jgi:hypothetical protein